MIDTRRIQARGALVAYREGGPIVGASENAADFFGPDTLEADPAALFGPEGLHAIRNTASLPAARERSLFSARAGDYDLYTHVAKDSIIVEAERPAAETLPCPYEIERDVDLIAGAGSDSARADLLKTLSGYREVTIGTTPFDGLVASRGLLVIEDVTASPVDVLGEAPPLGNALLRLPDEAALGNLTAKGVASAVVLRSRNATITMTHTRPRVPSHRARLVLLHLAHLL